MLIFSAFSKKLFLVARLPVFLICSIQHSYLHCSTLFLLMQVHLSHPLCPVWQLDTLFYLDITSKRAVYSFLTAKYVLMLTKKILILAEGQLDL